MTLEQVKKGFAKIILFTYTVYISSFYISHLVLKSQRRNKNLDQTLRMDQQNLSIYEPPRASKTLHIPGTGNFFMLFLICLVVGMFPFVREHVNVLLTQSLFFAVILTLLLLYSV